MASGVQPAERVAIRAPNSIEWVIAVPGLFEAGATRSRSTRGFEGSEASDILAATELACW